MSTAARARAGAAAGALAALLALASCGGGGSGGGSPGSPGSPAWQLDASTAAPALADGLGLAEAALGLVHQAQAHVDALARVGPLPRAVFCRGGSGSVALSDRDGDGRASAGDRLVVDYSRCGFGPLGVTYDGRLQIDIESLSADGLQLQALLSMPDGLGVQPGFLLGPTGRWQGRLHIETGTAAGQSRWSARAAAADGLRFAWAGTPSGTEALQNLAVERVLGHADARVQWTASLEADGGRRGQGWRLATPVALAASAGHFPDALSGRARFELSDAAGNTLSASPQEAASAGQAPTLQLELSSAAGRTALPASAWSSLLNGLGLWSGLDEPIWPLRAATARGLRVISRASGSQDMHRPLRLLLSRPLAAGALPQFLLEDMGRLETVEPAIGQAVPMDVERDGLMVTLRPARGVPDSTRLRLRLSLDGHFAAGAPVVLDADDGSQLRLESGVLAGFSTWDRLLPRIGGAPRRGLLMAGSSLTLDAAGSADPAWITSYRWAQVDGPLLTLDSPSTTATRVGLAGGAGVAYASVRLEVRNAAGQQAQQDLTLKTVQAGASAWMLYLSGQPGDYVVGPRRDYFTEQIGRFRLFAGQAPGTLSIVYDEGAVTDWRLALGAADGRPLAVGVFEGARRSVPGAPVLDFSGEGRTCSEPEGRFEVFELERDGSGQVVRLAVDFEQRCRGSSEGLVGSVRHNSARPLPGGAQPASR